MDTKTEAPDRKSGRNPVSILVGALVLAGALFVPAWFVPILPLERDELTVTYNRGGGAVVSADGTRTELAEGTVVRAGDVVELPEGAAANLSSPDGHNFTVTDESSLRVEGSKESLLGGRVSTEMGMERGELRVSGESGSRASLDIGLPNGVAGVRGTVVELEVGPERAAVSLHEGRVDLGETATGSVQLRPGEGAVVTAAGAAVRGVPAAPRIRRLPRGESVIRAPGTHLYWTSVHGADAYQIEIASDEEFLEVEERLVTEADSVELPILELADPLHLRVQALTNDGLKGTPSLPYPIEMAYEWSLGLERREARSYREALEHFELARERFGENADLLRDIGWTLYTMGRHAQSRDVYEEARALEPEYDEMLVELGRVYFWLADYTSAEAIYREVLDRRADYADALWGLGDTYRVIGRRGEALELVRRAVQVDPNHPYAPATLRQLRSGG